MTASDAFLAALRRDPAKVGNYKNIQENRYQYIELLMDSTNNIAEYNYLKQAFDIIREKPQSNFNGLDAVIFHLREYAETKEPALLAQLDTIQDRIQTITGSMRYPHRNLAILTDIDDTLHRSDGGGGSDKDAAERDHQLYQGTTTTHELLRSLYGTRESQLFLASARPSGMGYAKKVQFIRDEFKKQASSSGKSLYQDSDSIGFLANQYDITKFVSKLITTFIGSGKVTKARGDSSDIHRALIRQSTVESTKVMLPGTSDERVKEKAGDPLTYYAFINAKIKAVSAYTTVHPNQPAVFFGDNGQGDVRVAELLRITHPNMLTFIHNIATNERLPDGSYKRVYNSDDIAVMRGRGVIVYNNHQELQSLLHGKSLTDILSQYQVTNPSQAQIAAAAAMRGNALNMSPVQAFLLSLQSQMLQYPKIGANALYQTVSDAVKPQALRAFEEDCERLNAVVSARGSRIETSSPMAISSPTAAQAAPSVPLRSAGVHFRAPLSGYYATAAPSMKALGDDSSPRAETSSDSEFGGNRHRLNRS